MKFVDLTLPSAISGGAGGAIVASSTRWLLLGRIHGPVTMCVTALAGAAIGAVLTRAIHREKPHWSGHAIALVAATAPVAATTIAMICEPELLLEALSIGFLLAVAIVPLLMMASTLARTAQRSRARSLIGRSDRRAPWVATAAWLAIVAVVGIAANVAFSRDVEHLGRAFRTGSARQELARVPVFVALAAWAIAMTVAVLDARERRRLRAAIASANAGQRVSIDLESSEVASAIDLGIGDDGFVSARGRETYRAAADERLAVLGDVQRAPRLLAELRRRSLLVLLLATLSAVSTVAMYVDYTNTWSTETIFSLL